MSKHITLTDGECDTLEAMCGFCVTAIDCELRRSTISDTEQFALRLSRTKVAKLRQRLFPTKPTK